MNDTPIVGVLAGQTVDHLLIDVPLHVALCGKSPRGKVLCELHEGGTSVDDMLTLWERSFRQCSWCAKKWEKRQRLSRWW